MKRDATILSVILAMTASAGWAALSVLPRDMDAGRVPMRPAAEEIVIKVAPEDLSRCVATLMGVMQMPVDAAHVTEISVDMPDAPSVRCEAE